VDSAERAGAAGDGVPHQPFRFLHAAEAEQDVRQVRGALQCLGVVLAAQAFPAGQRLAQPLLGEREPAALLQKPGEVVQREQPVLRVVRAGGDQPVQQLDGVVQPVGEAAQRDRVRVQRVQCLGVVQAELLAFALEVEPVGVLRGQRQVDVDQRQLAPALGHVDLGTAEVSGEMVGALLLLPPERHDFRPIGVTPHGKGRCRSSTRMEVRGP
jgi:hypothetical protein